MPTIVRAVQSAGPGRLDRVLGQVGSASVGAAASGSGGEAAFAGVGSGLRAAGRRRSWFRAPDDRYPLDRSSRQSHHTLPFTTEPPGPGFYLR